MNIYTIGHSTRTLEELVELLRLNEIQLLADVRTAPGSRRLPHFARAVLELELPRRGVGYVHLPALGGLRKPRPDSINGAWRNLAFRGYADYMQSAEFRAALENLERRAGERRLALMCAEAVPWRCHRSLLADALEAQGFWVLHITGKGNPSRHSITPFAVVESGTVTYPDTLALRLDG